MPVGGGRSIPRIINELHLDLMRDGRIEIPGDLNVLPLPLRMMGGDVVGAADLLTIDQHLYLRVAVEHVA